MVRKDPFGNWSTKSKFSKPVNMPKAGDFVRKEIYDLEMSVPALAKRLNISPARAYRLLSRSDWRVSEIMNVSMVIDINLFAWYAEQTQAKDESAPMQQRIAELEKQNEKLRVQLELLEKVAGIKANELTPNP